MGTEEEATRTKRRKEELSKRGEGGGGKKKLASIKPASLCLLPSPFFGCWPPSSSATGLLQKPPSLPSLPLARRKAKAQRVLNCLKLVWHTRGRTDGRTAALSLSLGGFELKGHTSELAIASILRAVSNMLLQISHANVGW